MTDRTTMTPHPSRNRAFVVCRPITAFRILAFGIAYPVVALVTLAAHRVIPGGPLLDWLPVWCRIHRFGSYVLVTDTVKMTPVARERMGARQTADLAELKDWVEGIRAAAHKARHEGQLVPCRGIGHDPLRGV
jgi:hypothetical protein